MLHCTCASPTHIPVTLYVQGVAAQHGLMAGKSTTASQGVLKASSDNCVIDSVTGMLAATYDCCACFILLPC